ncbi:unnamed protein product, partial [Phaeothamnion confervicola]
MIETLVADVAAMAQSSSMQGDVGSAGAGAAAAGGTDATPVAADDGGVDGGGSEAGGDGGGSSEDAGDAGDDDSGGRAGSAESDEEDSTKHLNFLLDGLEEPALISVLQRTPALTQSVSRLLPFLTYGDRGAARTLAAKFVQVLDWEAVASAEVASLAPDSDEAAAVAAAAAAADAMDEDGGGNSGGGGCGTDAANIPAAGLRRRCFAEAAEGLGGDRTSATVRDCLLETGFLAKTAAFVLRDAPGHASGQPPQPAAATGAAAGDTAFSAPTAAAPAAAAPAAALATLAAAGRVTEEWEEYFRRPALPAALRALTGLCRGHRSSQEALWRGGLLPVLHRAETTSVSGQVGLLAETLLEAVAEGNEPLAAELAALRARTREAKRLRAQQQRERALRAMGVKVPVPGIMSVLGGGGSNGGGDGLEPAAGGGGANGGAAAAAAAGLAGMDVDPADDDAGDMPPLSLPSPAQSAPAAPSAMTPAAPSGRAAS